MLLVKVEIYRSQPADWRRFIPWRRKRRQVVYQRIGDALMSMQDSFRDGGVIASRGDTRRLGGFTYKPGVFTS